MIEDRTVRTSFQYSYHPEGTRKKTLPNLRDRLDWMKKHFIDKFEAEPQYVFMRPEMLGDEWSEPWPKEEDIILGMEIVTRTNLQMHNYVLAVNLTDYLVEAKKK